VNLLERTKELCRLYDIRPSRSKGQNFLVVEKIYDNIVEAAELNKEDTVLEVGPGLGFLTIKLAQKVKRVVAVELDDKLAEVLKTGLIAQGIKNVEVVNEDILRITNYLPRFTAGKAGELRITNKILSSKYQISRYKVVANLPYNISSIFLRKFLSRDIKPILMVLMLQKEVAERIIAHPPKMSLLAVSTQFYADSKIIEYVPKENFWPRPEVDSTIIKLEIRSKKLEVNEREFFRLVKFGFSAKRKMLKNNLAAGYRISQDETEKKLKKAGFNPKIRAQELSVNDWMKLFGYFA